MEVQLIDRVLAKHLMHSCCGVYTAGCSIKLLLFVHVFGAVCIFVSKSRLCDQRVMTVHGTFTYCLFPRRFSYTYCVNDNHAAAVSTSQ